MKYGKIFVAFLAACLLIAPALSMPTADEMQDKNKTEKVTTDAENPAMDKHIKTPMPPSNRDDMCQKQVISDAPRSMMDGRLDRPNAKNAPKDDRCQKQVVPDAPRSMMDGRLDRPNAENAPKDDRCQKQVVPDAPRSMMDGKIEMPAVLPKTGSVYVVIVQA